MAIAIGLSACHTAAEPRPPQQIIFSLGTSGALARALIAHYNAVLPTVHVVEQPTYGAFVIASSLQDGRGDIGIAQADAVYLAYRRGVQADPRPHTSLRGIAVLGMNAAYIIVRRDSSLRRIGDLRGKRIGINDPGTSGELVARIVLEAYGLTYSDIHAVFQRVAVSIEQLARGTLDAIMVTAPIASLSDRLKQIGTRALSIDGGIIHRLRAQYPFLRLMRVPASELWGQENDLETVGADALLLCRKELSEDVVYQLTKEFFAVLPTLAKTIPDAVKVDPDLAAATPIPLHPGAARFYREREILK